jgi:hypothetical protein
VALRQGILGSVFLNVPYDDKFEALFIAYIAGLTRLGFGIYVTFAEPGPHRLSTIIGLIEKADFSIHDLSRIERSKGIPRFNMPLELGMSLYRAHLTLRRKRRHLVYLFESTPHRVQQSTSDTNGMDPQIHGNTPEGVMRGLRNLFSQTGSGATVRQMMVSYESVNKKLPRLRQKAGGGSLYEKALFEDVVLAATTQHERAMAVAARRRRKPPMAPA